MKEIAIVLGGVEPHIELIKQLRERNYYVILVDYLNNPPAKAYADLHVQESTMDLDKVVEIAKKYNAKLVITACVDQANITACYVAEKLGLPRPYSYETACNITNKGYMKKTMFENVIPTTKYHYLEGEQTLEVFDLSYPVMVKPADSYGTSGVKRANNREELESYLADARKISRTGRAVVEEVALGVEVSAYCFIKNQKANIIMISERLSVTEGEQKVLKCYATITPPNISQIAIDKIRDAADKIAEAFQIDNTPLHVQAFANGDDINIIEFAARVAGGLSYRTIRENTGMDMISGIIDSYLEQDAKLTNTDPKKFFSINIIYGKPGIYDYIAEIDALIEQGIIDEIHYYRSKGAQIGEDRANAGRIAAFICNGKSREELCKKAKEAYETITVYDMDGKDITRRDLCLR